MRKKILFIGQFPPPIHGVSYINKVIKNSERINKKLDIIYYDYRFTNNISSIGKYKLKSLLYFINNIFQILKILRKEKREIVFTIVPVGIAFYRDLILILIIRLFFKLNFKLYLHAGNIDSFIKKNPINKSLYMYLSSFSTFIFLREGLYKSLDINFKNVSILNNFYPKLDFTLEKTEDNKIKILFLSNYIEDKGVLLAIEIFKKIVKKNKMVECFLVGSDADLNKEQLNLLIDPEYSEQIKVLGPLYGFEKYNLMSSCDLFIFPSKYEREAFPVTILEAVACGCLVINSSINGINEIFDTENMLNEDYHIIKHFVEKINYYLKSKNNYDFEKNRQIKTLHSKYQLNIFEKNFIKILRK